MGELVDAKGRVRYFCTACGVLSHGYTYCRECEPPDTVREGRGPKWWSREWPRARRAPLSRRILPGGIVDAPPPTPFIQRRARKGEAGRLPDAEEMPILHAMMNALRELLGLDPLYGQDKKGVRKGQAVAPHPHYYDEREQTWKGR